MAIANLSCGISPLVTDDSLDIRELGRMVEDHGFASFWLPEHTHIPVERENQNVSPDFSHFIDQFTGLTAVAAVTSTLRIGTSICEVPAYDPITLAKRVSTLDMISGGRFDFGIAAGGIPEEIANHGTDPARRQAVMRERVLAMKEIWTKDEAEFHGNYVDFGTILQWPKPVQKPHPPILMGGTRARAIDRTLDYADGWIPAYPGDPEALVSQLEELKTRGAAMGRDYPVTLHRAPTDPAALSRFIELGVTSFIFRVPIVRSAGEAKDALAPIGELVRAL